MFPRLYEWLCPLASRCPRLIRSIIVVCLIGDLRHLQCNISHRFDNITLEAMRGAYVVELLAFVFDALVRCEDIVGVLEVAHLLVTGLVGHGRGDP